MKDKLKLICCIAAAAAVLLCGIFAFVFLSGSASLLAALPLPDETRPYALAEAKDGCYPTALTSLPYFISARQLAVPTQPPRIAA